MLGVDLRRAVLVATVGFATSVLAGSFGSLGALTKRAPIDPNPISVSPSQNWYDWDSASSQRQPELTPGIGMVLMDPGHRLPSE